MNYYYIMNNIFNFDGVSTVFSDAVERSQEFRIHFLDSQPGKIKRDAGKDEFLKLEGITEGKSEFGLKGITVKGKLDLGAKNLFYTYFTKAYNGEMDEALCHFELYKDGLKVFEMQDQRIGYILCDFYDKDEKEALGLYNYESFVL